jgi:hypothetical protein
MARFSFDEAENYGAQKSNYFNLKDNGDTSKIRFLYNDINDVEGVSVHEIEVDGKRMDIECLRTYNEPIHNCPLCEAGYKVNAKIYIPVYDMTSKESKIWTRGKTFFQKLSSLCSRYNPLVATPFEVERVGKKGDTSTTYETYPMQTDNAIVEDFPEINAEGTCFQVKSYNELLNYLQTGTFGDEANNTRASARNEQPQRRATRETPATPVRRRPNYSEEDSF